MTHQEFESVAALDAIGAATAEEAAAVRAHLETCDSCGRVYAEFADAATLLVRGLEPVTPPAAMRGRILGHTETGSRSAVEREEVVQPFFNRWWWSAAAMLFLALWGWRELSVRMQHERFISAQAEIARLTNEKDLLATRNAKLSAEIGALTSAGTKTIALTGQQVSPSASARVFLEPSQRRAVVFFYDMPANANDRSYQLWIIRADQPKPQSAGVFDVTKSGTASITIDNLPLETEIKGLAVTLEPRGGVQQPTNTNFYVLGNT